MCFTKHTVRNQSLFAALMMINEPADYSRLVKIMANCSGLSARALLISRDSFHSEAIRSDLGAFCLQRISAVRVGHVLSWDYPWKIARRTVENDLEKTRTKCGFMSFCIVEVSLSHLLSASFLNFFYVANHVNVKK